jgi:hypothetical protein
MDKETEKVNKQNHRNIVDQEPKPFEATSIEVEEMARSSIKDSAPTPSWFTPKRYHHRIPLYRYFSIKYVCQNFIVLKI